MIRRTSTHPGRSQRNRGVVAAAIGLALLGGCASKYSLQTMPAGVELQWPYQPARAKLVYLHSLTGLAKDGGFRSAMKAFVYGKDAANPGTFALPVAIAIGRDGRMAIADQGQKCVHLYLPSEQAYVRLVGTRELPVQSPIGLAFDDDLRLYLSDSAGRIYAFAPDGSVLYTIDRAGEEPLRRPTGVAFDPDRKLLYVVDTLASRVHAFDPAGGLAFSFGGRGDGEDQFNFPTHIFRAASGDLYITDSLNFRIRIVDGQGRPAGSFGHHGDGSGDLAMPKGLAADADGVIYVADSLFDNVQLFDRRGAFLLTLGRRGVDSGEFWLPSGVYIDASDRLYVCDTYNGRIQVFRIIRGFTDAGA